MLINGSNIGFSAIPVKTLEKMLKNQAVSLKLHTRILPNGKVKTTLVDSKSELRFKKFARPGNKEEIFPVFNEAGKPIEVTSTIQEAQKTIAELLKKGETLFNRNKKPVAKITDAAPSRNKQTFYSTYNI